MKYLAWFSGGIASAVACKLAAQIYGLDKIEMYFFETNLHHPDTQRFIRDCEEWIGKQVIQVQSAKYKDPHDVMRKTGYVNGPAGARCTLELKKKIRWDIEEAEDWCGQVFGFDYSKNEVNRAIRFKQQNDVNPVFPLIEKEVKKSECRGIIESAGIEVPEMYRKGYHNNNCIGCIKGGKGYWNKVRRDFPSIFEMQKETERITGRSALKGKNSNMLQLKDLKETEGRHEKPITSECGVVCATEFTHIQDNQVGKVMGRQMSIYDVE